MSSRLSDKGITILLFIRTPPLNDEEATLGLSSELNFPRPLDLDNYFDKSHD